MNKKGFSTVIALVMIIGVVIVGVIYFDRFHSSFTTDLESDVEIQSEEAFEDSITIGQVMGKSLYIFSEINDTVPILGLSVNGVKCNITGNLTEGRNEINISDCFGSTANKRVSVTISTEYGVESDTADYSEIQVSLGNS